MGDTASYNPKTPRQDPENGPRNAWGSWLPATDPFRCGEKTNI